MGAKRRLRPSNHSIPSFARGGVLIRVREGRISDADIGQLFKTAPVTAQAPHRPGERHE